MKNMTLKALAELVGGQLFGDPNRIIKGVNPQGTSEEDKLCCINNAEAAKVVSSPQVLCVLTTREEWLEGHCGVLVDDFRRSQALVLGYFEEKIHREPGISPMAWVDPSAEVDITAYIGPFSVIEANAKIGKNCVLLAHDYVGEGCEIGEDSFLEPYVCLLSRTKVGKRTVLHPHVTLGADGFGFVPGGPQGVNVKVPQIGYVEIGDDVELGASSCVDRGAIGATVIGQGTKVDNLVQIGHNVCVGSQCLFASQSGIAGSTVIGDGVLMAARSGIGDHRRVGDGVIVTALAGVTKDVEAGAMVSGYPATDHKEYLRFEAALRKVPDMIRRLRKLEQQCEED